MSREEELMIDYYAARAAEYDKVYSKPERQTELRQIKQWLPSVLAGRAVLEIARRRVSPHTPVS
jgi:demethylmenaquinone methyltransferase/2-methoxy-6-polyprenyl-1,4-benzoquinol methylase